MDAVWWLILAVVVVWQLRQGIRRVLAASQRIDDDIEAFNRERPRAASLTVR